MPQLAESFSFRTTGFASLLEVGFPAMKIAGLQKNSLVDYPEKLAAVVFTQGCNMNCGYCHNRCLIGSGNSGAISEEEVFAFLERRRGLLDAVVISGGEPTLQKDLHRFVRRVRNMGFLIKLDTNGTNPDVLEALIQDKLLDYVAMDIKAPFCKYRQVCCSPVNVEDLQHSIEILQRGSVDYEFRTTYTPQLEQWDLLDIAALIRGARKYVLQQYREVDPSSGRYTGRVEKRSLSSSVRTHIADKVAHMQLRGEFLLV